MAEIPGFAFSNPRLRAEFADWPSGQSRVRCVFEVHSVPKKGVRISRTTGGKTPGGRDNKPKFTTYSERACIVDGSDGRTYLLAFSNKYAAAVNIVSSDMQHDAPEPFGNSYIQANHPEFPRLMALIEAAELVAEDNPDIHGAESDTMTTPTGGDNDTS